MKRDELTYLESRTKSLERVMHDRVFDDAGNVASNVDARDASCWVATVNLRIELEREWRNHDE